MVINRAYLNKYQALNENRRRLSWAFNRDKCILEDQCVVIETVYGGVHLVRYNLIQGRLSCI